MLNQHQQVDQVGAATLSRSGRTWNSVEEYIPAPHTPQNQGQLMLSRSTTHAGDLSFPQLAGKEEEPLDNRYLQLLNRPTRSRRYIGLTREILIHFYQG